MSNIADAKNLIQTEEVAFSAAVSEATGFRMGATMNFLANRVFQEKNWYINGTFGLATPPQLAVDGMTFFKFDAQIIDVWMFVETNGSSGYTEFDILRATSSGGSFSSIFTATPRISAAAGNYAWLHVGSSVASPSQAPVINVGVNPFLYVNAGDALRCDLLTVPGGGSQASGCGIIVQYQPR